MHANLNEFCLNIAAATAPPGQLLFLLLYAARKRSYPWNEVSFCIHQDKLILKIQCRNAVRMST